MPKEYYKKLVKQNIDINIKDQKNYISKLMLTNDLNTYNDLYDIDKITIDFELTKYEIENIDNFLSINKNLTSIYLNSYTLQNTENILKILKKHNKKNITIYLDETAIKDIKPLKKLKKRYKTNKVCYTITCQFNLIKKPLFLIKLYINKMVILLFKKCAVKEGKRC